MLRKCTKCNKELDINCFNINRSRKDGLTTWCKECQNEYNKNRKNKYKKVGITTKICSKCKQELPIEKFSKNNCNNDGYETQCKRCKQKQLEKYIEQKKNEVKPCIKYKICSKCKQNLLIENFNKNIISKDGYNNWCKTCQKEYDKIYYKENIDKCRESNRRYRENNREKLNELDMIKYYSDIKYRLNILMSCNIYSALKGAKSEQHWEDLVGYSVEQLKEHLESQFDENMTWDNIGEYWEIDHIVPKGMFYYDSIKDKEFKICWSLANLRPLEWRANRSRPKNGSDISEELKQQILNQNI